MSQEFILKILKDLGGRATQREIEAFVRPEKPAYSQKALGRYVNYKLHRLKLWELVKQDGDSWVANEFLPSTT